jgi:inactivated superfamily I helicase
MPARGYPAAPEWSSPAQSMPLGSAVRPGLDPDARSPDQDAAAWRLLLPEREAALAMLGVRRASVWTI